MKKGFTLIELLVVIAIIAILAAILFPVFAQAREKARSSSCLSNCKQIGTALQLYTDDYDETVPIIADCNINDDPVLMGSTYGVRIHGVGTNCTRTWVHMIFPYLKNVNMLVCPSLSAKPAKNANVYPVCYGTNICLSFTETQLNSFMTSSIMLSKDQGKEASPKSLAQIKDTAKTVFCADGNVNWYAWDGETIYEEYVYLVVDYLRGKYANDSSHNYGCRHNGGNNFTFCDGHAKYYKGTQGPCEDGVGSVNGGNSPWWNPDKQ